MNSQTHLVKIICGFGIAVLIAACSTAEFQAAEKQMSQPINCATAEGDIRMLNSEKANVGQQIAMGVTSIVPTGLLAGGAKGTAGTKVEVATGEYNTMIDRKITEIKTTCGLQ